MGGDGRQQPVQSQNYLPDIPLSLDIDTQNLLTGIVQQLQAVQPNPAPPGVPTGLSATAATLGNLIKWSPVATASSYRVYRGTTNSFAAAVVVQQLSGNANTSWYDPFTAAAAAGQYYWVAALNASGVPGPTSAMLTITAGINVNDIFAQNITATGTITGATIRTAASGARIQIDSTNGLRAINASNIVVLAADLSGNVAMTGTIVSGSSGARVEINGALTNGIVNYLSDGSEGSRFLGSGMKVGTITGYSTVTVYDALLTEYIIVGDAGSTAVSIAAGSAVRLSVTSSAITASVPISMGTNNITFTSGQGIASSGTSFAVVTTDAQIYQSSTLCANFNTTDAKIRIGGTLYTLSVVAGIVNAT